MNQMLTLWLGLLLVLAVAARVAGPSDLYDNDQPKTVAYTVDMLENGRWLLPYDMLGRPATKPPLYNWIGLPALAALGPSPWVLKLPSILSSIACIGLTVLMARRLLRLEYSRAPQLALVAAALWLANPFGMKLLYLARPDAVLAAALTAAWAAATTVFTSSAAAQRRMAICFWLCLAAAALAKGPAALVGLLYAILAAKLIAGRWSAIHRLGWWWGLPLAALIVGSWAWAAHHSDPAGFRAGLIGDVVGHPSITDSPGRMFTDILTGLWELPAQFMARFAPWSIFAVLTLIHIPLRKWFRHPLGPAVLWLLLIIVVFSLSPRRRPDYLAPCLGAASILAAYWLIIVADKYRLRPQHVMTAAAAIVIGLSIYHWYLSPAARTRHGEHARAFAAQIRQLAGDDPITFQNPGYNELSPLLGRNPSKPSDANEQAAWIVRPIADQDDPSPVLVSGEIADTHDGNPGHLGLYLASPVENPSHSP